MNHGHVIPNADGSRARCGGPAICAECAAEFAKVHGRPPNPAAPKGLDAALQAAAWQASVCLLCRLTNQTPRQATETLWARIGLSLEIMQSRDTKGLTDSESRRFLAETFRWLLEVLES